MVKKIIALKGIAKVGKSSTIRKVYELLKEKYPNCQCDERLINLVDITVIITINDIKIGIESQGDPNGNLLKSLPYFAEIGCKLIICATRTSGGTVEAVNKLQNEYEIIWLNQDAMSSSTKYEMSNYTMAQKILGYTENTIVS